MPIVYIHRYDFLPVGNCKEDSIRFVLPAGNPEASPSTLDANVLGYREENDAGGGIAQKGEVSGVR